MADKVAVQSQEKQIAYEKKILAYVNETYTNLLEDINEGKEILSMEKKALAACKDLKKIVAKMSHDTIILLNTHLREQELAESTGSEARNALKEIRILRKRAAIKNKDVEAKFKEVEKKLKTIKRIVNVLKGEDEKSIALAKKLEQYTTDMNSMRAAWMGAYKLKGGKNWTRYIEKMKGILEDYGVVR